MLVAGSEGEAYFEGTTTRGKDPSRLRLSRNSDIVSDEQRSVMEDYADSIYTFERECADVMLGRREASRTVEEYLRTLVAMFRAYDSAERGEIVEIA